MARLQRPSLSLWVTFHGGDMRTGRQSQEAGRGRAPPWGSPVQPEPQFWPLPARPAVFRARAPSREVLRAICTEARTELPQPVVGAPAEGGGGGARRRTRVPVGRIPGPLTLWVPFPCCWLWSLDAAPC